MFTLKFVTPTSSETIATGFESREAAWADANRRVTEALGERSARDADLQTSLFSFYRVSKDWEIA